MTPTEIENINREFATEVMGWTNLGGRAKCWMEKSVNFPSESLYTGYYDKADALDYFDPYHRWDHAAMGLEKFPMWTVRKDKKLHQAMVRPWSSYTFYSEWTDTAPAAITLACIEAKKEEE